MSRVKHVLMLPVWIASVFTQAKYFGDNPVIGNVTLNRCGLHVFRVVVSRGVYLFKQALMCRMIAKEDRVFFRENGCLIKENVLPADIFAALETEILAHDSGFRRLREGDTLTERAAITSKTMCDLPVLARLLHSKPYFNPARYTSARNERPTVYIERVIQHHYKTATDPQKNLHKDTFHPTVKSWLYIDDVIDDNGPFVYVPGSHRLTRQRLRWEYRVSIGRSKIRKHKKVLKGGAFRVSEEARVAMGAAQPRTFAVKKNTLIIADTFGLHCRGNAATSQPRRAL